MEFWLKVVHIAAMAVWFTGLFLLPRLLLARCTGERDGEDDTFNHLANTLFFRVMTPAAVITVLAGMGLIAWGPEGAWLVMKLVVVALAVLLHLYFGLLMYELGHGRMRHGPLFHRIVGWAPLVLLLTIAALTGAKPRTVGDLPAPPRHASNEAPPAHSVGGPASRPGPSSPRLSSSP